MQSGSASGGADRSIEQQRQNAISSGTNSINSIFDTKFNDDFYEKRKQSYLDFATPQLEDQYGKAQKELTYALARRGSLDSSARGQQFGELSKLFGTNQQSVADQAVGYENTARSNIAGARGDLINMLSASGDVSGASNAAVSRAAALSAPETYSPLGDMFHTFTSTLGTQAALERAAALSGGLVKPTYSTGLFGTNPSAVVVK